MLNIEDLQKTTTEFIEMKKKSRWSTRILIFIMILATASPLCAVLLSIPTDSEGRPASLGGSVALILALLLGVAIYAVFWYGSAAIESRWMKQDDALKYLARRYDLKQRLIEDLDVKFKAGVSDPDGEHAYRVLDYLDCR